MYGENDHTNRGDVAAPAPDVHEFNFPRRHYQRYQLEFLKQAAKLAPGGRLLEYGCGDGFYLEFSRSLGFTPVGIEYNADLVELLRSKSDLEIYVYEEFAAKYAGQRFDVVHFGHILEHLPDPRKAIHDVLKHTHADTVFLQARMTGPGDMIGDVVREVEPGGEFYGLSYRELQKVGAGTVLRTSESGTGCPFLSLP
jgi:2-polyprenyl-3-methyl-5-hydroxy-6-metoxy-1,4-benzoquinol methylase